MKLRKKIQSYFLLAIYLLVLLHHCISHSHASEDSNPSLSAGPHHHENFTDVHHEHHFHKSVFHFLGHLFETVSHSNDLADDHVSFIQKTFVKKGSGQNQHVAFLGNNNNLIVLRIDAESLPDPPLYHLFLLHRLKQPLTPLRAPPTLV